MGEICTDDRFELIQKYKEKLIQGTNIETAKEEMNVIDNILFRFWQMGWLEALEKQIPKKPIINERKIQCINGHNQPTQHYKYCPMCGQLMDWSDYK